MRVCGNDLKDLWLAAHVGHCLGFLAANVLLALRRSFVRSRYSTVSASDAGYGVQVCAQCAWVCGGVAVVTGLSVRLGDA